MPKRKNGGNNHLTFADIRKPEAVKAANEKRRYKNDSRAARRKKKRQERNAA